MLSRATLTLSGEPPARLTGCFFGGNRMLGSTATMSISRMARMTRRSTVSLGNGIVSARMERMAAENALDAEPRTFHGAVAFHRLECVPRARRHEATLRKHEMRQRQLVTTNEGHDDESRPALDVHVRRVTLSVKSARSAVNGAA